MFIFKKVSDLQLYVENRKKEGKTVGFTPTMGALHKGHMSLIGFSKEHADIHICSIFVNPTQFNDKDDLKKYPRPIEKDIELLYANGCDALFLPEVEEVYPDNPQKVELDLGQLDKVMEGAFRPGHFEGVVQVVKRLLDIVLPDKLFMGQKDFQQFTIIQHMINELKIPTELVVCPIKRMPNGLAMSSRNVRLSDEGRERASLLFTTLEKSKHFVATSLPRDVEKWAMKELSAPGFEPEYFTIVDGRTLQPFERFSDTDYAVACLTVWHEGVRLIDNMILKNEVSRERDL